MMFAELASFFSVGLGDGHTVDGAGGRSKVDLQRQRASKWTLTYEDPCHKDSQNGPLMIENLPSGYWSFA